MNKATHYFGKFFLLAIFLFAWRSYAASYTNGKPLFYQGESVVNSVVCGDAYSFDVFGYSGRLAWVELKKDNQTIFDGLLSVPMSPYTSTCNAENNDAGQYQAAVYETENGAKGRAVASQVFTIYPQNTENLFVFRSMAPGILSTKVPAFSQWSSLLFYFLRKYEPSMDILMIAPANSWFRANNFPSTGLENSGGPLRPLIDGIGTLPAQFPFNISENSRFFGITYMNRLKDFKAGIEDGLTSLVHEIGHSWGVYVAEKDKSGGRDPLGMDNFPHWGPFTDNFRSILGGPDRIIDKQDGTFKIEWVERSADKVFNDFDLYAMGLLPSSAVRSTFVIARPGVSKQDLLREINNTCCRGGSVRAQKSRDVTINDIIAIEGRRDPLYGFTKNNTTNNLRVSFLVVQGPDGDVAELNEMLTQVKNAVSMLPARWSGATRGLSSLSVFDPIAKSNPVNSFAISLINNALMEDFEGVLRGQVHTHQQLVSSSPLSPPSITDRLRQILDRLAVLQSEIFDLLRRRAELLGS